MKKACEYCGEEFEAKRESGRYCSAKCRKLAFQKKRVSVPNPEVSVANPEVSVANPEVSVANNVTDNVTRDDEFYKNLTGEQAQELLREACKIDSRIDPDQEDWMAISAARLRRKMGLPKPYVPRPPNNKASILTGVERDDKLSLQHWMSMERQVGCHKDSQLKAHAGRIK